MVDGPVSNRRFSRRVVRQAIVIGAAVVMAMIVIIGGSYLYRAGVQSRAEAAKQAREAAAQSIARELAAPFLKLRADMSALTRDPDIVMLFERADPAALEQEAARRAQVFPGALKLRFFLPGRYELDTTSDPPLSYISLDLLRRAEESAGPISLEAHLLGKPGQHIVLVDSIRNTAGQLIGLAHLSLDVALFEQTISGLAPGGGYLELRQADGGRTATLAATGKGPGAGEPVIVSVADSRWNVAYWPAGGGAPAEAAGGSGPTATVIVPAAIVLLAAAAAVYLRRRAGIGVEVDSAGIVYGGAVKAIMEGAHPGMEQLVPNLPRLGQKKTIRPVSMGMVGADVTMIMRKSDLAQAGDKAPDKTGDAAAPARTAPPAAKRRVKAADVAPLQAPAGKSMPAREEGAVEIAPEIFRAYDIRGVAGKTLTAETVTRIGQAIGSEAAARQVRALAVGRDGRSSSPELAEALIQGLRASGCDVIDIGMVPTPLLYFAAHELAANSGVMVTGSHNPPEYNGLKVVLGGETLAEEAIRAIRERILANDLQSGAGNLKSAEVNAEYILKVTEDIPVALGSAFKLVVDCGNGVAGVMAPQLLRALGHDVIELFCEVDGSFPNHQPDPSQPENLRSLIEKVREERADMGLAFDGDGDRLGVVDGEGNIIWPDRQLMLLAQDVLSRNPDAPIIFDVKCSRHLRKAIESAGGRPVMWRTGHSLIKKKMKELDSPLAGEMSGHIFFRERWYGFDDAFYAAGRLLEILVRTGKKPVEVFAAQPRGVSTPELRIDMPEVSHAGFMRALKETLSFDDAEINEVDGYRVEFADGWGLVRPSNTSPVIVLRFEADDEKTLQRIQAAFRDKLLAVNPDLTLPF